MSSKSRNLVLVSVAQHSISLKLVFEAPGEALRSRSFAAYLPPPAPARQWDCVRNSKNPVFVGGVFFILTRDLDLQKMWVACIKEQKIISCLYSWHLLNNFSFANIFCKSRLTFFHCIWCVLRVSTYVLCVQHVFTIGMILSATERHTTPYRHAILLRTW